MQHFDLGQSKNLRWERLNIKPSSLGTLGIRRDLLEIAREFFKQVFSYHIMANPVPTFKCKSKILIRPQLRRYPQINLRKSLQAYLLQ